MIYIAFLFLLSVILFFNNPAISLLIGIIFSFLFKPTNEFITHKLKTIPLQIGIVILGLTINLSLLSNISLSYLPWISVFVVSTFLVGVLFGKLFGIDKKITYLISAGSAICGASAMIVIAPIIQAKPKGLLMCLTIIFLLNALAIFIFPNVAQYLELSPKQFGIFSALSIHDTGSVIGASILYSDESAQIAATLKLGRTVWIIPLLILLNFIYKDSKSSVITKFPIFIIFFITAVFINSIFNFGDQQIDLFKYISLLMINVGLFCIGTQAIDLNLLNIKVGRVLLMSILLWIIVIVGSWFFISYL